MCAKKGAPYGNRNALRHGFYSSVLSKDQRKRYLKAASIEGLDGEISILRLKLSDLLESDGNNFPLILKTVSTLSRLLRTRDKLSTTRNDKLGVAYQNIIRDIGVPLGVCALKKLPPAKNPDSL